MTYPRLIVIVMGVALIVLMGVFFVKTRPQKPSVETPAQSNVSLELPGLPLKLSRTVSSTKSGWDLYTNEQLNVALEVPSGWTRREYVTGRTNAITAVAFDPLKVLTEEEYRTLDLPVGRVVVRRETPYAWSSVVGLTKIGNIGPEQIPVRYAEPGPAALGVNTAWAGMTVEVYYSTSNTVPISIEIAYPTNEREASKQRAVLDDILDSIRSAHAPDSTSVDL